MAVYGGGDMDRMRMEAVRRSQEMHRRTQHDELPTPEQLTMGIENLEEADLKVDYIVTHEPPLLVKSSMLLRKGQPEKVNKLNGYFEEIAKSVKFNHWYFGSLHEDRLITADYTCLFEKIIPLGSKEQP